MVSQRGTTSPIGGVYNTEQLATILGVHRRTIQRLILSGELGAIKVGRRLRVTEAQLKEFVRRQEIHQAPTQDP